jgi:hypothetical protein
VLALQDLDADDLAIGYIVTDLVAQAFAVPIV